MRRVLLVLVLLGALLGQSVMPAAAQTSVGYRFHVWHDGNGNGVLDASGADTCYRQSRNLTVKKSRKGGATFGIFLVVQSLSVSQ